MNDHDFHLMADQCPYDFAGAVKSLPADDEYGYLGHGADLAVTTLMHAYRSGVFPWFGKDEPIAWFCPSPRCVIIPSDFVPKKSLQRTAKKSAWQISTNLAFAKVIDACSKPRAYTDETWIGDEMKHAYQALHELGVAHSVEVWQGKPLVGELVGGLYGVKVGAVFCGESMFHRQTDASKMAFWALMKLCQNHGIMLADCQLVNDHLMSLGATAMPRADFLHRLNELARMHCQRFDIQIWDAFI